ncbi:alpha/beta fold hydrolase [Bordetella petrii]|nr:alpha/beta fold hydrolase [Bordetella petrii]
MPQLKLKDATINYRIDDFTDPWTQPEVVLLHHGCGRHMGYWYRWVPVLARKYKVLRLDARGFGESSDPGEDYPWSIEAFADDAIALLDHLGIEQAYFVGEFMGSWTGIQMALSHPGRIKKLVLGAPPYFWTSSQRWVKAIDGAGVKAFQEGEMPYRFGDDVTYGKWFVEEMAKARPHAVRNLIAAAGAVDYRPHLSRIGCSALVLLGEHFARDLDQDVLAQMRRQLPAGSEVRLVEGGRMFALYNLAEHCAELSMSFFEQP